MHKKFMMACMAIAAFAAFVIAPSASATTLTETGEPLAVGASVEGTNSGAAEFKTSAGTVSCTNVHLKGKVTQNNDTTVKGEIPVGSASYKGTGTSEDCTSSIFGVGGSAAVTVNSKLCLEAGGSGTTDTLKVTGCGANVTFTLAFTGSVTCKYSTASVSGTYTTNTTPAVGTIPGGAGATANSEKLEGESFLCPGSGELIQKFTLTTTANAPVNPGEGLTLS